MVRLSKIKVPLLIATVLALTASICFVARDQIYRLINTDNVEAWEQYDSYVQVFPQVKRLIDTWNTIDSLEDPLREDVRLINRYIYGTAYRFSSLKIDKLSPQNKVYWLMDTARLNNILYDLTREELYLRNAILSAKEAEELVFQLSSMPSEDTKFIENHHILESIDWILLASYSMSSFNGNKRYQKDIEEIISKYGGCDYFSSVIHKKMRQGLPCSFEEADTSGQLLK